MAGATPAVPSDVEPRVAPRPPAHRPPDPAVVERAVAALTDPALEPIVEFVVTADRDGYEVRAVDGRVRFRREADGSSWRFRDVVVEGRHPLAATATDRLWPLTDERTHPWPHRTEQSYPHAYEQVAQLFDHPAAPDIVSLHTAAHNWEDQGGSRGEHGSLGIVQVRAPFVLAGAGVRTLGTVPRSCRLVDVAPTVMALLGAEPTPGIGPNGAAHDTCHLARQDGTALLDILDPTGRRPRHVVGFLWDGCNANVLHDLVARDEAPNVARLIDRGVAFAHGAMASLPSVTLANHTTIQTGCHPGHHGILHNAWYDRARGEQVITNSPATWAWATEQLAPGVETLHQAIHRRWPDARTVSVNEPCDAGADHSTFDVVRAGGALARAPRADELPFTTERFVRPEKGYERYSRVDHSGLTQAIDAWADPDALPRYCFVNFTLTDAAFHRGGPYSDIARASVHDTDARMGEVLDAVERAGALDDTAFFLVADHGMEETDPTVTGNWAVALDATGIPYRDEAYGFIYLG